MNKQIASLMTSMSKVALSTPRRHFVRFYVGGSPKNPHLRAEFYVKRQLRDTRGRYQRLQSYLCYRPVDDRLVADIQTGRF